MFGEVVRAYRRRKGMSQEELAEAAGLSVRGLGKIEAGRVEAPRPASVRLLADALGLVGVDRERFVQAAAGASSADGGVIPRQLPAEAFGFIGRVDELDHLDAVLAGDGDPARGVAVCVIEGSAGVGKTALALRWAHRAAGRFPDGHLYLDLRGFAGTGPLSPLDALARLLYVFGVPADRIPADVDVAESTYRSAVAGRKLLLVLDNAASAEQVRPLLPTGPGTAVLVTGRDRLRGLTAREGARRLALGVLSRQESIALLGRVLGDRANGEPEAVAALAELCGGLPLALRIAAANLAGRPTQPIADYVAMLRDDDQMAALAVRGDPDNAVLASFDLSYGGLPPAARRTFRLLSVVPGPDVAAPTAAAVAGTTIDEARHTLDLLVSAHLLEEQSYRRYRFHDLLRRYAANRARRDESATDRAAAEQRLYDLYLSGVDSAARLLYPEKTRLTVRWTGPAGAEPAPAPHFHRREEALAWLGDELPGLVAAVTGAHQDGLRPKSCLLADALRGYFWLSRSIVDWTAVAEAALAAARAERDPIAEAAAWLSLADVHQVRGDHQRAIELYERARQTGSMASQPGELQLTAVNNLGLLYVRSGRLREAAACFEQLLAFHRHAGLPGAEVLALANLGSVYHAMGQLDRAADLVTRSLAVSRETQSPASRRLGVPRTVEGYALCQLGEIRHSQGEIDQGGALLTEALAVFREVGDGAGEARAQLRLAAVDRDRGQPRTDPADRALAVALELRDLDLEADAHNVLGTIHHRLGHHKLAIRHHLQALELARDAGLRHVEAEALIGLGTAYVHTGARGQAHAYLDQAITITRRHGYPLLTAQATAARGLR